MVGAQKENFELNQTLNGCVNCFNAIPKEYISIAKVIGTDTMPEETSSAIQQRIPDTQSQLTPNKETLDLQNKGNFEDDEKTSKRTHCPLCSMDFVAGTMFCVWCKTNTLFQGRKGASSHFTPRRLCLQPSSYEVGGKTSNAQRLRQRTMQRAAAVRQGQGPLPKGRDVRCQYWKRSRETQVPLHHRKVGIGPDLSRKSLIRKPNQPRMRKHGTTSRPRRTVRTIRSTNAQRRKVNHLEAAFRSQVSTRWVVQLQYRKTYRKNKEPKTANIIRTWLDKMAHFLHHFLTMWLAMARMTVAEGINDMVRIWISTSKMEA